MCVFIYFSDTYIQKVRKNYMDSRARKNLTSINTELHDVQRIMVQNIDDVLQRGDALSGRSEAETIFECKIVNIFLPISLIETVLSFAQHIGTSEILPCVRKSYLTHAILPRMSREG